MRKGFLLALSAVFLLSAGCQLFGDGPSPAGTEPASTDPVEQTVDLDSPTGGYTATDEKPAFGEEDKFYFSENESEFNDSYANTEQYRNQEKARGARKYRLRAIWGRLERSYQDSTVNDCCRVDFSGELNFKGGVAIVERTIGFELLDYVYRDGRSTIKWVSHTCPHIDGIQFKLIALPNGNDSTVEVSDSTDIDDEIVLTIEAGPYSGSFTLAQLDSLDIIEPVDRCGNGIMIKSHPVTNCPHGYMLGQWINVEPDTLISSDSTDTRGVILGRFRGIWVSERGRPAGYLRGVFGTNSEEEHVFYGKYIDFRGRFKGILKGHYGSYPTYSVVNQIGWFKGIWLGRNAVREGYLKGDWASDGNRFGFFHGKWGKDCIKEL